MKTIRIGGVPEHYNLPFYQLFEEQALLPLGVQVDWQTYPSGTGHMLSDLSKGVLDMAIVLTEGAVLSRSAGDNTEIYATYVSSPLTWGVHAHAQSGYVKVEQIPLQKAVFGISRYGSGSHLMAALYAHSKGIKLTKSQFQIVNNLPGAILALEVGMADLFLWEKYTTQPIVDQGSFIRLDEFHTPWDPFVLVGNGASIELRTEVLPHLIEWLCARCKRLKANRDSTINVVCSNFHLSEGSASDWFDSVEWNVASVSDAHPYAWIEDLLIKAGVVEPSPTFASA